MHSSIGRDKIREFLLDTIPEGEIDLVARAIETDENLRNLYEEEKNSVIIHQYVSRELSPHEQMEFEFKLRSDRKKANEVKLSKEINNAIEELSLEKKLNRAYKRSIHAEGGNCQNLKKIIPYNYSINGKINRWMIAASVVILFVLGSVISYNSFTFSSLENRLYEKYYSPYDYTDSYLSTVSSFNKAKQKYLDGEYKAAFSLLKDLPSTIKIEVERDFFMALSLMETGEYNKAVEVFKKVIASPKGYEYIPQARWYLGLCYLKIEQKGNAVDAFRQIVRNKDYNHKKANRILASMDGELEKSAD